MTTSSSHGLSTTKADLVRALLELLTREVGALEESHKETRAAATHEEAKPENDKDTRALEQSYLARGQALRIQELREAIARVRSVAVESSRADTAASLGSLVTVHDEEEDVERTFFLMPAGGGARLSIGTTQVLVVTPESPWGRALVGARASDSREVTVAGKLRDFQVLTVR